MDKNEFLTKLNAHFGWRNINRIRGADTQEDGKMIITLIKHYLNPIPNIISITSNPKKKITTVVFENNNMQMSKCSENDDYDLNVGVAMCIAYEQFRSKNQFHKFVEKTAKIVKSKEKEV